MTKLEQMIQTATERFKKHRPLEGKDMLMYKKGYLAALQDARKAVQDEHN